MAASRYPVLGLSLLALLLVGACSGSIFSKDETKVSAPSSPLQKPPDPSRCTALVLHTQRTILTIIALEYDASRVAHSTRPAINVVLHHERWHHRSINGALHPWVCRSFFDRPAGLIAQTEEVIRKSKDTAHDVVDR